MTPAYACCELLAGRLADPRDDIYAIANQQGWVIGLTLERAVAALKKEIADPGGAGRGTR